MTKFFLSAIIAISFTFVSFSASATTAVSSSSTATAIKKVKKEGDLHRIKFKNGTEAVFQEGKNGSMQLICICSN